MLEANVDRVPSSTANGAVKVLRSTVQRIMGGENGRNWPALGLFSRRGRVLFEAKRQLRYTSKAVSEIAYALGFDDPAYFTRFFSRRAGMSPRAYRARGPIS